MFLNILTLSSLCLTLAFLGWDSEEPYAASTGRSEQVGRTITGSELQRYTSAFDIPKTESCCDDEGGCVWGLLRFSRCYKNGVGLQTLIQYFNYDIENWPFRNSTLFFFIIIHAIAFAWETLRHTGNFLTRIKPRQENENTRLTEDVIYEMMKDHNLKMEEMASTVEYMKKQYRFLEAEKEKQTLNMIYQSMALFGHIHVELPVQDVSETSSDISSLDAENSTKMNEVHPDFIDPDYEWDSHYDFG